MTNQFDAAALDEVRKSRLLINQFDEWLFKLVAHYVGERVLEVGCGHGNVLRHLTNRSLVVGVDIDGASVDQVRLQYGTYDNVHAYLVDVTSGDFLRFGTSHLDTVLSINVLEHIEDDELALVQISRVLSPAGRLILVLPAHSFLFGTMDKAIGHFRRYTLNSLQEKLSRAGFVVRLHRYINPIGALGWFVNARLLRRKVPPRAQLRVFNRLIPFLAPLQENMNLGFGLSVLSVSEKASSN